MESIPVSETTKVEETTSKRPKRRVISQSQAEGLKEPGEVPKTRKPRVKTPSGNESAAETPVAKPKPKRVVRKKAEQGSEGSSDGALPLL